MALFPSVPRVCRNCEPISFSALVLFAATVFGSVGTVRAQENLVESEKNSIREKVQSSLATATWHGASPGLDEKTTAVCVKKDGWYVFLVPAGLEQNKDLTLTIDGIRMDGEILAMDLTSGLCLAKTDEAPEASTPLLFSRGDGLEPGSEIVSLGEGMARIAGKDREYLGEILPVSMLRVHLSGAAENRRGEPIFSADGEVAGLLTDRALQNENEAHAVPSAQIAKFVEDYDQHQQTGKNWIGASFHRQSTIPEVVTITPDSPAEAAGLKPGDIVLKVGGKSVASLPELAGVCENLPVNEPAKLQILRGLETIECELTPVSLSKKP